MKLEPVVVKGFGVSLLGLDWFRSFGISLEGVLHVDTSPPQVEPAAVHNVINEFPEFFSQDSEETGDTVFVWM